MKNKKLKKLIKQKHNLIRALEKDMKNPDLLQKQEEILIQIQHMNRNIYI